MWLHCFRALEKSLHGLQQFIKVSSPLQRGVLLQYSHSNHKARARLGMQTQYIK